MEISFIKSKVVMAHNLSHENGRFSKLKGRENYDTWKISARSYLVIKKVWSCMKTTLAANATQADKDADLLAWSELNLLLDESVYSYIADTTTAKAAWDALESAFEDSGLSRKVELLKQLIHLKLSDCSSMEEYVSHMIMTSLKVKKTGLVLGDEVIASFMLAGLPDSFQPLVMAVENTPGKLTMDNVKTVLLQDPKMNSSGTSDHGDFDAFYSKSGNQSNANRFRCHKCGEQGHFAKNCKQANVPKATSDSSKVSGNGLAAIFRSTPVSKYGSPL